VPRRQPVYLDEGDSCTRLNANLQPGSMPRKQRLDNGGWVQGLQRSGLLLRNRIGDRGGDFGNRGSDCSIHTRGQMEEARRTRYVDALKPGWLPLPLEVRHSTKQTLEGWMQEDSRTFPGPAFMTMSTGPGASTLRFLGVVSRLDPGIPMNPRCPESDVDYRALTVEVTSSAGSP
jgi:hypothetical protein